MVNLRAITKTGNATILGSATLQHFKTTLQGQLLRPSDPDYDAARKVWNGMIDRYPALIVRCRNNSDVISAVNFAQHHNLLVAVRGGGHNVAGSATCNGGIVIDLSPMNDVQVDPQKRIACVQGGATWGDVDRATQPFGLATPGGLVSETGVAGLTLSGGFGWLRSKYGLSCDNLIAADVVTADGRLIRASETDNSDLFWGIRGGGGNFGIVTSFEYRLHPVGPDMMLAFVFYPADRAQELLQFYRNYCAAAPDEVSAIAVLGKIPATEIFPTTLHGQPFVLFGAVYAGAVQQGEQILQPLRDLGDPLMDLSGPMPYLQIQTLMDEEYPAHTLRYYWKSVNLTALSDAAIAQIITHTQTQVSPLSTTDIWHVGGAIHRVAEADMAYSGRQATFMVGVEANWVNDADDDANITWVRHFVDAMLPFSDGSRYFNFPGFHEEGDTIIKTTFGEKYDRLVELKNKYDPTNLFCLNANIKPTVTVPEVVPV